MKLTMKTLYASADRTVQAGQTADFPTKEAKVLLDGGFAVKPEDDPAKRAPADDAEPGTAIGEPPRSGAGSGKKAWLEYAAAVGIDVPDDATREGIWALVDAAKNDAGDTADDAEDGDDEDGGEDGDDE